MSFLLKKLVSAFLMPVPFGLLLVSAGIVLAWRDRVRVRTKIVLVGGFVYLLAGGFGIPWGNALKALERKHPMFPDGTAVEYVVVLGGGYSDSAIVPPTSRLTDASLGRLIEGMRIYRASPGSRLVFTGRDVSAGMREAAVALGVSAEDIVCETDALDTAGEARSVGALVGERPFALVTSASHMPRAVAMFTRAGLKPIPAPTRYLIKPDGKVDIGTFFPQSGGYLRNERGLHELLGLVWARIRGQA